MMLTSFLAFLTQFTRFPIFLNDLILAAQGADAERLGAKSLESAVAFSQTLSQWCFVIIGGTVVILLQSSSHRPAKRYARWSYMCFGLAWVFFASSIYFGTKAQRVYLAYLLNSATTWDGARSHLNPFMNNQIWCMEAGLACLIPWLLIILGWWVFDY
jgi:hypothetical protein